MKSKAVFPQGNPERYAVLFLLDICCIPGGCALFFPGNRLPLN